MDSYLELLKLVLPELLVAHFDLASHRKDRDVQHLHFEEKIDLSAMFSAKVVIAHGFHKELTIQYFPVSAKNVFYILNVVTG